MQGGVIGGICFLAFLLSIGRTEELESKVLQDVDPAKETVDLRKSGDLEAPGDLKSGKNQNVTIILSTTSAIRIPRTENSLYCHTSE